MMAAPLSHGVPLPASDHGGRTPNPEAGERFQSASAPPEPLMSMKPEPRPRIVPLVKVPIGGEKVATANWWVKEASREITADSPGSRMPLVLPLNSDQ